MGVLLLILLCYIFLVYISNPIEGMCTLDDNESGEINIYYGKFGQVAVKTNSNGEKTIVGVKRNTNVKESNQMILYGPDDESITIYKSSNGKYLIANPSSTQVDSNTGNTITYYGNNGSVTMTTNSEGNEEVSTYNFETKKIDSVETYWGPNGNSVNVVMTSDGKVKLVSSESVSDSDIYTWNVKNKKITINSDSSSCDNYIRKTEIVPPVCPACPSVTSCEKINDDSDDHDDVNTITGPKGGSVTQTKDGTVVVKGAKGGQAVVSDNGTIVRGPEGGVVVKDSEGNTGVRGPGGNTATSDSQGNVTVNKTITNMNALNNGKVGMYLGDNSVTDPMPVLNNFSSFSR